MISEGEKKYLEHAIELAEFFTEWEKSDFHVRRVD